MRIPSGTPVYVVNRDENEKLFLAKLHITVSIPGNFEVSFVSFFNFEYNRFSYYTVHIHKNKAQDWFFKKKTQKHKVRAVYCIDVKKLWRCRHFMGLEGETQNQF